jgi:hypothetical protein
MAKYGRLEQIIPNLRAARSNRAGVTNLPNPNGVT